MKCFPGLQRSDTGRYRLRRVIPKDVRPFFDGKKNKVYPLGTDKREAITLAKLSSAEFDLEVDRARASLRSQEDRQETLILSDAQIERLAYVVKRLELHADEDARVLANTDMMELGRRARDTFLPDARHAITTGDYTNIEGLIEFTLHAAGYGKIDREDRSFLKARHAIVSAFVEASDAIIDEREIGRVYPTPPKLAAAAAASTITASTIRSQSHQVRPAVHTQTRTPSTSCSFAGTCTIQMTGRYSHAVDFRL